MRVSFHPEFAQDILDFEADYARVSPGLAVRFRQEVEQALDAVTRSPGGAGHFLQYGSDVIEYLRRRNLHTFPFFLLYGYSGEHLVFGAVIPSRSDPLSWLARFSESDWQ